jgi:hypothetical protein
MKKRKIRRARGRGKAKTSAPVFYPKGHDFGTTTRVAFLGDLEFNRHLIEAQIVACAYGIQRHEELGVTLPSISLVGENPEPLRRAFASFHTWAKPSDADVVELSIVTLNEGGYLIGVNTDAKATIDIVRTQHPLADPLVPFLTWAKKMDTRHPFIEELRDYQRGLVAPFLLDGAVVGSDERPLKPTEADVRQVDDLVPLLKFKCMIVSENDVEANTAAAIILAVHRKAAPMTLPKRKTADSDISNKSPVGINTRRRQILSQNFPVTLARFRQLAKSQELMRDLSELGLLEWQVEQAACNLVLSKKLCPEHPHYGGLSADKFVPQISDAVRELVETADGKDDLAWIDKKNLFEQVLLDGQALMRWLDHKGKSQTIEELQNQLRPRGLLGNDSSI